MTSAFTKNKPIIFIKFGRKLKAKVMKRNEIISKIIEEQQKIIENLQNSVNQYKSESDMDEDNTLDPDDFARQTEAKDMQLRFEKMLAEARQNLAFMENEVDSIICAGMGGRLTIRIIQADLSKLYNIKELILQPQSEIHLVRRFLSENGFMIVSENMIYEDGKYYPIMKAVPNHGQSMAVSFHKEEVLLYEQYGALLLNQKNRILLQYLQWKQSEIESITQQIMKNSGSETRKNIRLIELSKEKAQVKQALQYFEGE